MPDPWMAPLTKCPEENFHNVRQFIEGAHSSIEHVRWGHCPRRQVPKDLLLGTCLCPNQSKLGWEGGKRSLDRPGWHWPDNALVDSWLTPLMGPWSCPSSWQCSKRVVRLSLRTWSLNLAQPLTTCHWATVPSVPESLCANCFKRTKWCTSVCCENH